MSAIYFLGEQVLGPWEKMWADALHAAGHDVFYRSLLDHNHGAARVLGSLHHRVPESYRPQIKKRWDEKLNQRVREDLQNTAPDFFFCYNDARLTPKTIDYIRSHVKKILVLLGDNPFFYAQAKPHFLYLVENADVLLTADRAAEPMLHMYDNAEVIYTPAGSDPAQFYPLEPTAEQQRDLGSDLLFVGSGYGWNSFGYHRARLMNELADLDLKIYGNRHWEKFYDRFPALRQRHQVRPLSQQELNIAQNSSKIYVVITNSWLMNGVPTRTYDALASGTFVLAEHRDEYEVLFPGGIVPTYRSARELRDKALYYLKNDGERRELAQAAHAMVLDRYLVSHNIRKLAKVLD